MAEETTDWGKHKRAYLLVFGALCILTVVTVALGLWAPLDKGAPGPTAADYVVGLLVATVKATLVALIFMHLNHEKGLIYKMLVFTFLFFLSLMALSIFAEIDPIVEEYPTLESTQGKLTEQ